MDKRVSKPQDIRRRHAEEFKQELMERSLAPGASVAAIAQEAGVNANLLFNWRRLHLQALAQAIGGTAAPVLLPVTVVAAVEPVVSPPPPLSAPRAPHRPAPSRLTSTALVSDCAARRRGQRPHRPARVGQRRMIGLPSGTRVWIVAGHTDMRKGFDGLAALVQTALAESPFKGHVFVFRGRRGDIIKVLWFDGQGLMLLAKRLERGRFVWPQATSGSLSLTPAQLSMLLEGIDWRMPMRTHHPELAA